jgi:hypothetical protein
MSLDEWWIDGDVAMDAGGNLYAVWDTQGAGNDIGWLSQRNAVEWKESRHLLRERNRLEPLAKTAPT